MSIRSIETPIRDFAARHGYDVFSFDGRVAYEVYAASGGLSSAVICYFRVPGHAWPMNADLGREGRAAPGILAAELSPNWSDQQISEHLETVKEKYAA